MKQTLILLLAVLMVSCHKPESKSIELIAYHWSVGKKPNNDTLVPIIYCGFYAQINENGICNLTINDYNMKNRFISFNINDSKVTHKKNRLRSFKSNKEILKEVFDLIDRAKSDTVVMDLEKPFEGFYDGPSIRIIGFNKEEKKINLQFNRTSRSNINCVMLYDYLELKSETSFYNSSIDTTKILQAKEKLIKEIYKTEIKLIPIIKSDIIFSPPVIKPDK